MSPFDLIAWLGAAFLLIGTIGAVFSSLASFAIWRQVRRAKRGSSQ